MSRRSSRYSVSGGLGDPRSEVGADAVAHSGCSDLLRVAHQVRVPRRRVDPHTNPTR